LRIGWGCWDNIRAKDGPRAADFRAPWFAAQPLLVVNNLQVPPTGFPLGGSISYEFTEDSAVPDIRRARVFYDGSNLARVEVTFTDGSFKYYKLERS
jgi:hypothetical protein